VSDDADDDEFCAPPEACTPPPPDPAADAGLDAPDARDATLDAVVEAGGPCTGPTGNGVLAAAARPMTKLAASATHIFWVQKSPPGIAVIPRTGGTPTLFASTLTPAAGLAVAPNVVFYVLGNKLTRVVDNFGSAKASDDFLIAAGGGGNPATGVAVSKGLVYVATAADTFVIPADAAGGATMTKVSAAMPFGGDRIVARGNSIYVLETSRLHRFINGTLMVDTDVFGGTDLFATAMGVTFSELGQTMGISRPSGIRSLDDGTATTSVVFQPTLTAPLAIAVDGTATYWTENADSIAPSSVAKIQKIDMGQRSTLASPPLKELTGLVVDDCVYYWGTTGSGAPGAIRATAK
jgi:hypothetical protein